MHGQTGYEYYKSEFDNIRSVGSNEHSGLLTNISNLGRNPKTPDRRDSDSDPIAKTFLTGLDGAGDIVVYAHMHMDPIPAGERLERGFRVDIDSGPSFERADMNNVEQWELAAMLPLGVESESL